MSDYIHIHNVNYQSLVEGIEKNELGIRCMKCEPASGGDEKLVCEVFKTDENGTDKVLGWGANIALAVADAKAKTVLDKLWEDEEKEPTP